jgi:hypothetical protein
MKTLQQIFDQAVNGIRAQGGPATNDFGKCQYRAPNGNKCAVGQLIPDSAYDPKWDTGGGVRLVDLADSNSFCQAMRVAAGVDLDDAKVLDMMSALQQAHDDAAFYGGGEDFFLGFEPRVSDVASRFGLVYTPRVEV